jgi:hypothetical protein
MAKKWEEIESDPEFGKLSDEDKAAAKAQYFDQVVAPQVPKEELSAAHQQFFAQPEPQRLSPLQRVAQGVKFGFEHGGIPGAILGGGFTGSGVINEAIDKGTYEAGGKVTDVASRFGASPGVAAGAGYLTNVGLNAIPAFLTGGPGGKVGQLGTIALRDVAANELMRSALKPTLAANMSGKGALAVKTMLEKGYNVSEAGITKLKTDINALGDKVANAIANSGETINKFEVAKRLKDTVQKFEHSPKRVEDYEALKGVMTEFLNHPVIKNVADIPIQTAQKLKQGFGKWLGDVAYGEVKTPAVEGVKDITRGLKEEISKKVPAVAAWNKEESELIKTLGVAERRAWVEMNKNPTGLATLAENPLAAAAFMGDRSSAFKSLVANALYRLGTPKAMEAAGKIGGVSLQQLSKTGAPALQLQDVGP